MSIEMEPTPEARAEAKLNPGGWVYAIEGDYGPNDAVPPRDIRGCWKVGDNGEIVDGFIPNPNYTRRITPLRLRPPVTGTPAGGDYAGRLIVPDDFDEPLEELREYME
ncbi:MAG: hypothetical protein U0791_25790 [Gemmataceae bacterium]